MKRQQSTGLTQRIKISFASTLARLAGLAFALLVLLHNTLNGQVADAPIRFEDVSDASNIDFQHYSGGTDSHFLIETVTGGIVTLDFDNDGLIDIYATSGSPLQAAKPLTAPVNRLYRNEGNFVFRDVTLASGAGDRGFALGGAAADIDNDGDSDILIANYGNNVLLQNNGDGTFHRVELESPTGPRVGAGVAFLDVNRDGNLDTYISNYVDFNFERTASREIFGVPIAPSPKAYDSDSDTLLLNDGAGNWREMSQPSGIGKQAGAGMGVIAFDATGNGHSDVFVCNDSQANYLWENLGDGTFEEAALLAGLAYDVTGGRQASMGADVADWNQDGQLDIVTTNFIGEIPTLYENSGEGYFDDIGPAVGLGVADRSVTWGVGFGDFDNDSWPDLFLATGHLISGVTASNDSEKFETPNFVLRNSDGQRFEDVTAASGEAVSKAEVSRGIAVDDFDSDGRLDVVVLNLDSRIQVLANRTKVSGNVLQLRLVGTVSNRDAVGAAVKVVLSDGRELVSQVIRGRGYQSDFGSILHFGLGTSQPAKVVVTWPSGHEQQFLPEKLPRITLSESRQ